MNVVKQSCIKGSYWHPPILIPTLFCIVCCPVLLVYILILWVQYKVSLPITLIYSMILLFMTNSSLVIVLNCFKKYSVNQNGITVYIPLSRPVTYTWRRIYKIDSSSIFVGRNKELVIRCFLDKPQKEWSNKCYSLERYWFTKDSILVVSFDEELMQTLKRYIGSETTHK